MSMLSEISKPQLFIAKQRFVTAVVIDDEWFKFLSKDGYTQMMVGDYWVKCIDGSHQVMCKKNFERLFELDEHQPENLEIS